VLASLLSALAGRQEHYHMATMVSELGLLPQAEKGA